MQQVQWQSDTLTTCLDLIRSTRLDLIREYWTIYRRPGFLAVVWCGSTPTPCPPLPSVSSISNTQEDWERVATCWWERGKGVGVEPNHTTTKKPGPLYISQYSLYSPIIKHANIIIRGVWCRMWAENPLWADKQADRCKQTRLRGKEIFKEYYLLFKLLFCAVE